MRLDEGALATADIHDETEVQGHVEAAGEESDLLRDAVLGNFEVILGEARDEFPLGVTDGKSDIDEVHVGAELDLGQAGGGQTQTDHGGLHIF
ncbi:hypothetical protein SBA6_320013 [Candidatus Sulfopaludibacter sp. SbA6]|nr:hypothetical protein SBA6_320013 [Candidatus Sulfopaludibacter sp. SbA6]